MNIQIIRHSEVIQKVNPEGAKRRTSVKSLLLG